MRALLAAGLVACACSPGAFACEDADDCQDGERSGSCQPGGFCSFPDAGCPSGQRYGGHAGDLSGECVAPFGDTESSTSSASSPTSTFDPTGADPTSASLTEASASADTSSGASVDTTFGMTADPTSTADGTPGESSTTGIGPTGPELALWLELEDISFAAGIADSGPFDLAATCATDDACPTAVAGRIGQGAEFHGSGECIVVPHGAAFTDFTGLTVSAWVRLDELAGETNRMIVGKSLGAENNNTFELYYYDVAPDDEQLQGRFAASDAAESANASAGGAQTPIDVWTHIGGTWDGVGIALWIDGVQVSMSPLAGLDIDDHDVRIGCDDDLGGDPLDNVFVGVIDDIRIYREALAPEQIAALAAGEEP